MISIKESKEAKSQNGNKGNCKETRFIHLIVKVGKFSKLKYGDNLSKELDKINQIQSDLEEKMFKEFPKDANIEVFYGERPDITNLLKDCYKTPNRLNIHR